MINADRPEYVAIHPEQLDTTRRDRRRNCGLGVGLVAIITGTIALIVVFSHSAHSQNDAFISAATGSIAQLDGENASCVEIDISFQNTTVAASCPRGGLALSVSDLQAAETFVKYQRNSSSSDHFILTGGSVSAMVIGAGFDGLNVSFWNTSLEIGTVLHKVNDSHVENMTIFVASDQPVLQVHVFDAGFILDQNAEWLIICPRDASPTCNPPSAALFNVGAAEYQARGTFAPRWESTVDLEATGWYQSSTRQLLVVDNSNSRWINASGCWMDATDSQNRQQCVFDTSLTYGSVSQALSHSVRIDVEPWRVSAVVGSLQFPQSLPQPREVAVFAGYHKIVGNERQPSIVFAVSNVADPSTDYLAAVLTLPSSTTAGTAMYLDDPQIGIVDFGHVSGFPTNCPVGAQESWSTDLFQAVTQRFRRMERWMQLLNQ